MQKMIMGKFNKIAEISEFYSAMVNSWVWPNLRKQKTSPFK